ncbi:beta-ketoacyl-ACP reductase [Burkholderia territorii]|uniref:Beta-ketoacyl-ACP reductase n=2 Tax=Burkholderia territorii TaxID=1503055 RepID=A0A108E6I7_9BURK|nr:beta-ketoacyl-ACP reductase [Burkholderia territorii]
MGGIGEAISTRLYDAGYKVVVTHSPRNTHATQWLEAMQAQKRDFYAYPVDVANYASCLHCATQIRDQVGEVDILINNAGITSDATFKRLEYPAWEHVLRTNLDSVFNMTKPWLDGMVERGWGRIVNIASVIGSKGGFGQTNYAAAKAGIHGFTKSLALEAANKGVTVNTVSPGYIATRMLATVPEDVLALKIIPQIPVGRLGQPAEIAALVLYLVSPEAGFLTGANLPINGGQHMQ